MGTIHSRLFNLFTMQQKIKSQQKPPASSSGSRVPQTKPKPTATQPKTQLAAKEVPDYYGILAVKKTATWDEIRRNYRQLALKWHPDRNMHQAEFAAKEFQKIAEAYEVLSDDELRKVYDQGGSLAEACCKRKLQKSNEVGEDEEDDDDEQERVSLSVVVVHKDLIPWPNFENTAKFRMEIQTRIQKMMMIAMITEVMKTMIA